MFKFFGFQGVKLELLDQLMNSFLTIGVYYYAGWLFFIANGTFLSFLERFTIRTAYM
tara:strand:+ start:522 stop:692 length:171 start_codon:yes stop_codon:yes gene_type:complete